jgi:hypothetical protein
VVYSEGGEVIRDLGQGSKLTRNHYDSVGSTPENRLLGPAPPPSLKVEGSGGGGV